MFKRTRRLPRLLAALLAFSVAPLAHAFTPFVIKDIRVEGIQRTEAGTVFGYLPVRVGDQFTDEQATESIRALFGTGFFRDVRIEVEDDVVVVVVEERPAITNIEFNGMKEFDKDMVLAALRDVGFAEARIYDKSLLERAVQELTRQYLSRGKYSVEIIPTVTPLERNRVGITFDIYEGEVAHITDIKIIGAHAFDESDLLDLLQQTTPGWMTWYTKTDQYSRQKLQADIEALRSFYLNQGYLEFAIEPPQVSISTDRKEIFLTLTIREGDKFNISDIHLAGDLLGLDAELKNLLRVAPGDLFASDKVNDSSQAITDYLGTLGYAFANVNASPTIDRENKTAVLTFYVDPNRRVYVRRVNIGGNTRTRDEVIRREMRQFESAWYDASNIKLSRDRIDRLGYFQDVAVETPPVPGTTDQVDVNVGVQERSTGMLSLGVGYSTTDSIVLSAGISQDNIFGSGTNASLDINTSKSSRTIALSQTDPYFTENGISRSTNIYFRTIEPVRGNKGYYRNQTSGLGSTFGVPFTELDRVFFGLNLENNRIDTDSTSPQLYKLYVDEFGRSSTAVITSVAWSRDSRDSRLAPNKGMYTRTAAEASVAGDLKYYKLTYQQQYFWPINRSMTLALNGQFDYGAGYGGRPFPLIKNMYAGGIGTIRGFEGSSLGPRDSITGDSLGGAKRVFANAELLLPFPGTQRDRTLRWFVFLDAGNVFADDQNIDFGDLRYSTGVGLSWQSPIGPLKLSLATPLNDKEGDKKEQFQFQIGTGF